MRFKPCGLPEIAPHGQERPSGLAAEGGAGGLRVAAGGGLLSMGLSEEDMQSRRSSHAAIATARTERQTTSSLPSDRTRLSVALKALTPIARPARMMSQCNNGNPLIIRAIGDRDGEISQKDAPGVQGRRRSCQREGESPGGCLLDGGHEAPPQPRFLVAVVGDFSQDLKPGRLNKACPLHCRSSRASANTSSAEKDGISPRSKAASRDAISSSQAA